MRVAVIGSRGIKVDISRYIPTEMTELISGGAVGVDTLAEQYADARRIPKVIFKPDYEKYGKRAPLIRNKWIVEAADMVVAIWDGKSRGTLYTIDYARSLGIPVIIHEIP